MVVSRKQLREDLSPNRRLSAASACGALSTSALRFDGRGSFARARTWPATYLQLSHMLDGWRPEPLFSDGSDVGSSNIATWVMKRWRMWAALKRNRFSLARSAPDQQQHVYESMNTAYCVLTLLMAS